MVKSFGDDQLSDYNLSSDNIQPWSQKKLFFVVVMIIFVFLGLCFLGRWQLGRAEGKRAVVASYSQSSGLLAMESLSFEKSKDFIWHRVRLRGHYDVDKQLLWQNRFSDHKLGVEVLTPFYLDGGLGVVLVNRGWLSVADHYDLSVGSGVREIIGRIVEPKEGLLLGENLAHGSWPLAMQSWRYADIKGLYPRARVWPVVVRLDQAERDGFHRDWPLWTISPEPHMGYALQWFSLALVWLIGWFCVWWRRNG